MMSDSALGLFQPLLLLFNFVVFFLFFFWTGVLSLNCELQRRYAPPPPPPKELIYKRGYGKLNKARSPLTDNSIIEEVSGFEFHSTHPCVSVLNGNSAVLKFEMCLWYHIFPAFETLKGFILAGSWQVQHHLHWGSYSWDLHCGSSFQGGQQLFVAIQAKLSIGWPEEEVQPLYWVWWCWK